MKKKAGVRWGAHLRRLFDILRGKPKRSRIAEWLIRTEQLIGKHSGPPIHAGHSETDSLAWVTDLAREMEQDIARRNRGRSYDGNMALAANLGMILVAWYVHVHRAKSYDPNRPLEARRTASAQRTRFVAELLSIMHDDSVMGEVWGRRQKWNFPFGRGAKGGRFV